MSTDLQDRKQPAPDEGSGAKDKPKSALSITQVVAGALAAMTAAALGSRLSVAGTVVGAALASVVAAVASAIYTASLRRTTQGVSAVLVKVRPGTTGAEGPGTGGATTDDPQQSVTSTAVADGAADGWVLPTSPGAPSTAPTPAATTPTRARVGWKTVVVAAVLMFVVAALALTGLELATGRALSGGSGTTVGQVAEPTTRPSSTTTRTASPTPSATRSASPTVAPSATASSTPSSQPTPSSSPTASGTPSPSATPTLSAAPSASPTP